MNISYDRQSYIRNMYASYISYEVDEVVDDGFGFIKEEYFITRIVSPYFTNYYAMFF